MAHASTGKTDPCAGEIRAQTFLPVTVGTAPHCNWPHVARVAGAHPWAGSTVNRNTYMIATNLSLNQITEQLRVNWGGIYQGDHMDWAGWSEVTYQFNAGDRYWDIWGDNIQPMNATQLQVAEMAFETWDDVIGIELRKAPTGSEIQISLAYSGSEDYAQTYTDQNYIGTKFDEANIWLSAEVDNAGLKFGYYGYKTILHEIGHSLGLTHPGEYNETANYSMDAKYTQDTRQYSVMSYFDAGENVGSLFHSDGTRMYYSSTPMLHDIAAVQAIYGADWTTRTGDTVYGFNSNAGSALGNPFSFAAGNRVFSIWDAGGNDTIDASGFGQNQTIDLRPNVAGQAVSNEHFSSLGG
jgi:hypothetical protein